MSMENRFENCKILWGKRYRGKFTGAIRYAEAVVKAKDGKLYHVSASYDFDEWGGYVTADVHEVKEFNEKTKEFKKRHGFIPINSKEEEYLAKLLLEERDDRG